jgi:hypothetical protein
MEVQATERVRVRRLSSVIDEILTAKKDARVFVKTDTQGFDLQVLRSAGERLPRVLAIQVELAARPSYVDMPPLALALAELNQLGFDVTGIFPVAREMDHLRVIEFDCVMCGRHAHAAAERSA